MVRKTSFWSIARRIVFVLMLSFALQQSVAPAPAHAQVIVSNIKAAALTVANWVKKAAQYVMKITGLDTIISWFVQLYNLLGAQFAFLKEQTYIQGMIQSMSQRLQAEAETAQTDAIINTNWSAQKASVDAAYAAKHAPPLHQELCKSVLVHQLVTTTEDFEREISRATAEAVANRGRCPGCDEMGGDRAAVQFKDRMDQKMMDPLDGVPRGVDNSTKGFGNMPYHSADLMPVSDLQRYEMPSFVNNIYTDPVTNQQWMVRALDPNPKTPEQKFFKAQVTRLFHVAGSRPTPLMGPQLFTSKGMVQRAMFNHCAANENALIKQCTDWLAYHTRPNSLDAAGKGLRDMQNERCEAIAGELDKKDFGDCKVGLSAHETHMLTLRWCQRIQGTSAMNMAGATQEDVKDAINLCKQNWTAWRIMHERKRLNCTAALAARGELRQCWSTVNNLGPNGAADAGQSPEYLARWRVEKDTGGLQLPEYIMQIKATKLKKQALQGAPVGFDELELPKAVGQ